VGTGTLPGEFPGTEDTLGAADRRPRRGGRREAVLAGTGGVDGSAGGVIGSPGELGAGARAPGGAGLQPACPRANDRRCPSSRRIGVMSGHPGGLHRSPWWRGFLCGESRSGPDPSKRGQHGVRKEGRAAGLTEPRGASSEDRREGQVQRRSGLCSWIEPVAESLAGWVRHRASERILAGRGGRRSGLTKRAPFDEAARGDSPGGPPLGGESNPVKPSAGIATEGVRGNSVTFSRGRTRLGEGAPRGGIAIAIPQGRAG
jgi:hypothetical protein